MLKQIRLIAANYLRTIANRVMPELPAVPTAVADSPVTQLEKFFVSLTGLGFKPGHIVDVGANRGNWTREALRFFPDADYTLIEPQPGMAESIQQLVSNNPKIHYHAVGAGPVTGELPFTIHERDDSCTFAMSAGQAAERGYPQVVVPVVTVDTLLSASGLPAPEMIKIDAEGFDLEVLRGASQALERCEVVLVEAAILNKAFRNDLQSVVNHLDELGFRPMDITDINRTQRHGSLWLVEIAFTRRGGRLDSSVTSYS